MQTPGRVVKRSELADAAAWPGRAPATTGSIPKHVSVLRRELESGGEPRLIYNEYGVGYVLEQR